MITASFRHIRGLSPMRERQLWLAGVRSWSEVPEGEVLSPRLDALLREGVRESAARLAARDFGWFARALPQTEHFRLLPQVLEGAAFVDVESAEDLTVIGVMDAAGVRSFRAGRDLDAFVARTRGWTALVTFNGAAFDVPVLRRAFPDWVPPEVQIDLRHVFQRLKEKGGLKELEPRLGLSRPAHVERLRGLDAVALWRAQKAGDARALRRLIEYNLYDVFHLRPLAELGYNRLVKRIGMAAPELPVTERGALLYDVSRAVEAALAVESGDAR